MAGEEIIDPTDSERLDFLQDQNWTRWVGYRIGNDGHCCWPVFPGDNLRAEIDRAMRRFKEQQTKEQQTN